MIGFRKFVLMSLVVPGIVLMGFSEENPGDKGPKPNPDEKEYYQVEKVEEVVVTATMTPKALKDISTTVNVVGRLDIESIPSGNGLNILSHTPGIFVNRSGDFGRADVDIRGLGQNCRRVAVLVDGKPEKMGLFGCAVSHAFPLDNVDRIEVVKGPASVLYGGEALGGAVNIITRMPEKKFETDITAFYGSYHTQQFNLKHGANLNKFKYFITFDRRKSDGHIENANYSGYSVTGKLVYDLTDNTHLTLQGKYFDGNKHEPGPIDNPMSAFWNDYQRGSLDLSLTRQWEKNELFIKAYRNFGKHQFSDGWDSRDYTNGAVVRFTTRVIANNELTAGGDFRFFGGKSCNWPQGEWNKKEGSFFVQNEHIFNSQWILSTGLRMQLDSLYGQEWCPHLGVVFQTTRRTLFRAAVSKGFRSPQINELYMYPPANPNLEPERVWNYELGFERDIGKNATFKGSVFHMRGTNLIQTIPNPYAPPLFIFANAGEFSFYGAELGFEVFFKRFFSGHIAYSYLNTGDQTKGRPGQKIDLSVRFMKKKFYAGFQGQYVTDYYAADFSQNRIPSYFILNSRVIIRVIKGVDLLIDVNNIFDKGYQIYGEFPGLSAGLFRMPGRNLQIGIRFRP
ncbi:MAG: TonB-dependent receptor [Candidatus Aminicenantes bacterium]|nr:MAG: TonB-dependent receptor [Candidatus Aminicenantes bacterium]